MTWLTRNVRVLSMVSFLQDTASELLYPLLPIYLTTVLGAPTSVVGAIEGAAEGAASVTKMAVGPLALVTSDSHRRHRSHSRGDRALRVEIKEGREVVRRSDRELVTAERLSNGERGGVSRTASDGRDGQSEQILVLVEILSIGIAARRPSVRAVIAVRVLVSGSRAAAVKVLRRFSDRAPVAMSALPGLALARLGAAERA